MPSRAFDLVLERKMSAPKAFVQSKPGINVWVLSVIKFQENNFNLNMWRGNLKYICFVQFGCPLDFCGYFDEISVEFQSTRRAWRQSINGMWYQFMNELKKKHCQLPIASWLVKLKPPNQKLYAFSQKSFDEMLCYSVLFAIDWKPKTILHSFVILPFDFLIASILICKVSTFEQV